MYKTNNAENGTITLNLEADDMAIIVKRDGSILPVLGSHNLTKLSSAIGNTNGENADRMLQAYMTLSMIVTANCEPLRLVALELIGDKSIIDISVLSESHILN